MAIPSWRSCKPQNFQHIASKPEQYNQESAYNPNPNGVPEVSGETWEVLLETCYVCDIENELGWELELHLPSNICLECHTLQQQRVEADKYSPKEI
jgi:hypothetical protein